MRLPLGITENLAGGSEWGEQAQDILLAVNGSECLECGRVCICCVCDNLDGKLDLVLVS